MAFSTLLFIFTILPICVVLYLVSPRKMKNLMLVILSLIFYAWGNPEYIVLMIFSILFNYLAGLVIAAYRMPKQKTYAYIGARTSNAMTDFGAASAAGAGAMAAPGCNVSRDNGVSPETGGGAKPAMTGAAAAVKKGPKILVAIPVAVDLLLLCFFKYWGFLLDNINALFHLSIGYTELALPIGISFFTFSVISYVADVYSGKAAAERNIIDFALFVSFFPKVMSGPIVQYHDMAAQIKARSCTLEKFCDGSRLFIVGLGKKVLIADCLNVTFIAISSLAPSEMSVLTAWLGCICYTLVIYFDFSGYSDMAIGLGKMFGFDIAKNFDYPYISKSATEFWRRWHISLGRFFRDYVYIPLGGNRVSTAKHIRNIAVVWLLTGFWHGAAWNFIFWGGFYGVLLLIEKYALKNVVDRIPSAVQHIVAMLLIMVGWVFFFSPTLPAAFVWLGQMVGIGANGFVDATGAYYFGQSIVLILLAAVGSTPVFAKLGNHITEMKGNLAPLASAAGSLLVLVLSTAYMVNSTYSSFLYFKF